MVCVHLNRLHNYYFLPEMETKNISLDLIVHDPNMFAVNDCTRNFMCLKGLRHSELGEIDVCLKPKP